MNDEMRDILKCAGIPDERIAEHHFGKPVDTPYAVYYAARQMPFYADDMAYVESERYVLELYTDRFKDTDLIEKVEAELEKREINYDMDEDYFGDEDLYLVTFEYEVIANE